MPTADKLSPQKIDGVGPVDNRPSTDKLHHFERKKNKQKNMWHVTQDTWHVWGGGGGEHSPEISAL